MAMQLTLRSAGWFVVCVFLVVASLTVVPRALTPLLPSAPQGAADLLSYYGAWWLVTGLGLAVIARRNNFANPYRRGLALATAVMLPALVIAIATVQPILFPSGEYINRGLQSVYLVLAALVVPNLLLGTIAVWRGLSLPFARSLLLAAGWVFAFCAGLAVMAAIVQLVLVDMRRG